MKLAVIAIFIILSCGFVPAQGQGKASATVQMNVSVRIDSVKQNMPVNRDTAHHRMPVLKPDSSKAVPK